MSIKLIRKSSDMNSDSSTCFGYCPKPKKSKPSEKDEEENRPSSNWAYLPSIIIHNVFELLNREDRLKASSTCKNWRQNIAHPKWWPTVTFEILGDLQKAKFFTSTFGRIVTNATITINPLLPECQDEFMTLMYILRENNNLRELIIEPTHCHFDMSKYSYHCSYDILNVIDILKGCLRNLTKFSFGCIENFSHCLEDYLEILLAGQPKNVTHLGLASVKDIPDEYEPSYFDPNLITPFTNLKILSIDYDVLSDEFLRCLNDSKELERLIVHLHGISDSHPGTTNDAWLNFKGKHPKCQLRLTIIHAYDEIGFLHKTVLQEQMPLSHLKVFFCEYVNMEMLELLAAYYLNTLQSFIWVDSISTSKRSWLMTTHPYDHSPDPLILMSWLCKQLKEIVFYGYKYYDENLIGIASLRGRQLRTLEIAEEDVVICNNNQFSRPNYFDAVPEHLHKSWRPIKAADLHPVITDPTIGDSDEYLLPLVLADLH